MLITGIPEKRKKGTEEIFEAITAENFPKLMMYSQNNKEDKCQKIYS